MSNLALVYKFHTDPPPRPSPQKGVIENPSGGSPKRGGGGRGWWGGEVRVEFGKRASPLYREKKAPFGWKRLCADFRANRLILANRFRLPELNPFQPVSHERVFTLIGRQPGSANIGFWSILAISSCELRASIARTPFCAILRCPPTLFGETCFGRLKIANRRFEAIHENRLHVMKIVGRHLVWVWIGGVLKGHFPECENNFSEAEICRKPPESVPNQPRKGPDRPWKGSNQARKGPIFPEGFLPDFLWKFGA